MEYIDGEYINISMFLFLLILHFCRYCLQCFSSETVLVEHKETCLKINGKQILKLRSGSIKFKNHFKQLAVPFKIYADFECYLEKIHTNERGSDALYTEKKSKSYSMYFCLKRFMC